MWNKHLYSNLTVSLFWFSYAIYSTSLSSSSFLHIPEVKIARYLPSFVLWDHNYASNPKLKDVFESVKSSQQVINMIFFFNLPRSWIKKLSTADWLELCSFRFPVGGQKWVSANENSCCNQKQRKLKNDNWLHCSQCMLYFLWAFCCC